MTMRHFAETLDKLGEQMRRLDEWLTLYLEDCDFSLKPCPFCGEDLVLWNDGYWRHPRDSKCIAEDIQFKRYDFTSMDEWNERCVKDERNDE